MRRKAGPRPPPFGGPFPMHSIWKILLSLAAASAVVVGVSKSDFLSKTLSRPFLRVGKILRPKWIKLTSNSILVQKIMAFGNRVAYYSKKINESRFWPTKVFYSFRKSQATQSAKVNIGLEIFKQFNDYAIITQKKVLEASKENSSEIFIKSLEAGIARRELWQLKGYPFLAIHFYPTLEYYEKRFPHVNIGISSGPLLVRRELLRRSVELAKDFEANEKFIFDDGDSDAISITDSLKDKTKKGFRPLKFLSGIMKRKESNSIEDLSSTNTADFETASNPESTSSEITVQDVRIPEAASLKGKDKVPESYFDNENLHTSQSNVQPLVEELVEGFDDVFIVTDQNRHLYKFKHMGAHQEVGAMTEEAIKKYLTRRFKPSSTNRYEYPNGPAFERMQKRADELAARTAASQAPTESTGWSVAQLKEQVSSLGPYESDVPAALSILKIDLREGMTEKDKSDVTHLLAMKQAENSYEDLIQMRKFLFGHLGSVERCKDLETRKVVNNSRLGYNPSWNLSLSPKQLNLLKTATGGFTFTADLVEKFLPPCYYFTRSWKAYETNPPLRVNSVVRIVKGLLDQFDKTCDEKLFVVRGLIHAKTGIVWTPTWERTTNNKVKHPIIRFEDYAGHPLTPEQIQDEVFFLILPFTIGFKHASG